MFDVPPGVANLLVQVPEELTMGALTCPRRWPLTSDVPWVSAPPPRPAIPHLCLSAMTFDEGVYLTHHEQLCECMETHAQSCTVPFRGV